VTTVRIKLNRSDIAAFLNSAAVTGHLETIAGAIESRANSMVPARTNPEGLEPYTTAVDHHASRAVVVVYAQTYDGLHAEAAHRTLSIAANA
jgi:hypothetical protein